MRSCEVLIVGGGPAGSAAARKLTQRGVDVLVLDKETFPRLKLCAGWITPEVVRDLEMDPASYPYRFLTFERLHIHLHLFRSLYNTNAPEEAAREHLRIIEALLARDPEGAETAMRDHLETSRQRMDDALARLDDRAKPRETAAHAAPTPPARGRRAK